MKRLFFGENQFGKVTDKRFLELEIKAWLDGTIRKEQLDAVRYYEGLHDILKVKREMINANGDMEEVLYLPNNRIVDNQYARMVDQITNFEMGQPITFDTDMSVEKGKEYGERLNEVFTAKILRILKQNTKRAVNEGLCWLYPWIGKDEDGNAEFRLSMFPAVEVLPFWTDAEHTELDCAVRMYDVLEYDENEKPKIVQHAEVYDANGISRFIWNKNRLIPDIDTPSVPYLNVKFGNDKPVPYGWKRLPLIPFKANDEEMSLLRKCKGLQDALNSIISSFQNRMEEDTHNTVLVVKNYDGTDWGQFRQNLITHGIIPIRTVDGTDGGVDALTIEVNADNYKLAIEELKKKIIENCGGFDAKDERMNANPNQMNIESMYADIEITANGLETQFQASFEQLLWFVRQFLKQTGKGDFDGEKAKVIFNRDMMLNEAEVIQNCRNSVGIISNETIMKNHSWVDDPAEEMKRMADEEQQSMIQTDTYRAAFEGSKQ